MRQTHQTIEQQAQITRIAGLYSGADSSNTNYLRFGNTQDYKRGYSQGIEACTLQAQKDTSYKNNTQATTNYTLLPFCANFHQLHSK